MWRRTIALTSPFCGMRGTMSASLEIYSLAAGFAKSSMATGLAEKNGSSKAEGEEGYTDTTLANSTMLFGLVKNCARAMAALGYFVWALTEMPMPPLAVIPDLPTG